MNLVSVDQLDLTPRHLREPPGDLVRPGGLPLSRSPRQTAIIATRALPLPEPDNMSRYEVR